MVFKQHVQCPYHPYHIVMVKQRLKISPFESESMTLISTPMNEEEEEEKVEEEVEEEEEGGREGREMRSGKSYFMAILSSRTIWWMPLRRPRSANTGHVNLWLSRLQVDTTDSVFREKKHAQILT